MTGFSKVTLMIATFVVAATLCAAAGAEAHVRAPGGYGVGSSNPPAGGSPLEEPRYSPILVPLKRSNAIVLTSPEDGVLFDICGDKKLARTAWTARGSGVAFLALDLDGDGKITNARELVGNKTVAGSPNGFDALIRLAGAPTAILDEDYELFRRLLLWEDANHNGISEPQELQPAMNVIVELGLGYVPLNRKDDHGNRFAFQGWATVRTGPGLNKPKDRKEGQERNLKIYDVFFRLGQ